jgi:anti-anti-sigma factor
VPCGEEENLTILDACVPSVAAPSGDDEQLLEPSTHLELRVRRCPGHAVVSARGELLSGTVGNLRRLLDTLVGEGCDHVVLDLSRLYDLDEIAIAELSRLKTVLTARSGSLSLAAPRPWVRRLLEHMCLKSTFAVYPTVSDAVAEFTPPSRTYPDCEAC